MLSIARNDAATTNAIRNAANARRAPVRWDSANAPLRVADHPARAVALVRGALLPTLDPATLYDPYTTRGRRGAWPDNYPAYVVHNAIRHDLTWDQLCRLVGALKRFRHLLDTHGEYRCAAWDPTRGINSPFNCALLYLPDALVRFGFNADQLYKAADKVARWCRFDAWRVDWDRGLILAALSTNTRPRRAALKVRWYLAGLIRDAALPFSVVRHQISR